MVANSHLANAIRALSMDAVQKAKSGHPGMPMGMAEIAVTLWQQHLKHSPNNPSWHNRDRFVVSNGHGSMLLYSLLHLTGYDLPIEELKNFRQLHSKTPGHPEFGLTPGVETTTGPLGQGLANAVGMAIAEKNLQANFNKPNFDIISHYTYVFVGDGCLMEGVSHEACSLAGTLGLGKLIVFYDSNNISIDGEVPLWFTDNTKQRFESYNWQVIGEIDGHDCEAIDKAIIKAKQETSKPTLIICKTTIAKGAPNLANTAKSHGAPLGEEEIKLTKENINWPYEPFLVPDEVYSSFNHQAKGEKLELAWQELLSSYAREYPNEHKELNRRLNNKLPDNWDKELLAFAKKAALEPEKIATRKASCDALNTFANNLPELIGGSADLTGSNLTWHNTSKALTNEDASGNYLYYGVREFAMHAIMNGISLHGGFIPYGGTFLVFSDYARNAVRLSALMQRKVIFVYTHDSIGLGEDGPTHQPIEHLTSLRLIPNLALWRPADTFETMHAWHHAIVNSDPTALALSRQGVPPFKRDEKYIADIDKGAYFIVKHENAMLTVVATGTEVALSLSAIKELETKDIKCNLVSMPCSSIFDKQTENYKNSVLDKAKPIVAIEAGSTLFWHKYIGDNGSIIGIDRFGESAPIDDVYKECGVTKERIIEEVLKRIKK